MMGKNQGGKEKMKQRIGKRVIFFLLLTAIFALMTACGGQENGNEEPQNDQDAEAADIFEIAVIPAQNQGDMQKAMTKLGAVLQEKLNREVEVNVYPDYNGVVEAMNFGQVDMAFFGPLTYVIAHEKSGAKAIVTQLIDGKPFYHSYIITHADSPWETLEDLLKDSNDVTFTFGDPSSTSGALIPGIELKDRGVYTDPNNHQFENVRFSGSHDVTALSVQNKLVDAGAIDSAIFDILVEEGTVDGDQFKVIWESDKIFQYPWAVEKDTDQETIDNLREAFTEIKDEDILSAFGASAFTIAENKDYETIRKAAEKEGRLE
jgi:phosphonate transport system substrate-binding protein